MSKVCYLCKSAENDELLYGKFHTKYNLTVHYYCLLLSSNLVQNGQDERQGIFGFLAADIRKENARTKTCRCYICKQMHANVFCCAKKCLRTFHTVCGIKNRCLSHFTDTFQSWCKAHVPLKDESRQHLPEEQCFICYEEMGHYDKITSIRAPCCKNGWFHQQCVARFAQTAGYFFKCPLCNNVDTFVQEMPKRGVFVPERDAAWELEPDAFQEQLERPNACDAEECRCSDGRETDNRDWDLLICCSCGSTCRHRECMDATESRTYVCSFCRPIVGVNIPVENGADDDDDDDGDEAKSSMDFSEDGKHDETKGIAASEESGVQCSSSDDESTLKPCRLQRKNHLILKSENESQSEQSDTSMSDYRRSSIRKLAKRVRRLISDDSEETDRLDQRSANVMDCGAEAQEEKAACRSPRIPASINVQLDESSNTSGTSSLSAGRTLTVRANAARGRWIETSNESDIDAPPTVGRKVSKHRRPNRAHLDSSSSSDDVPLSSMCAKRKAKRSPAPIPAQAKRRRYANNSPGAGEKMERDRVSIENEKSLQSGTTLTTDKKRDRQKAQPSSSTRTSHVGQTSSSDSDMPLVKWRRVAEKTKQPTMEVRLTVTEPNSSNEENIRPPVLEESEAVPNPNLRTPTSGPRTASRTSGHDRESSHDKLQQSILKYIMQSPRNTPSKTSAPSATSIICASPATTLEPSKTSKSQKTIAIRSPREADTREKGQRGSAKKARRFRRAIVGKEPGQVNLLNYFNRY